MMCVGQYITKTYTRYRDRTKINQIHIRPGMTARIETFKRIWIKIMNKLKNKNE